VGEAEIRAFGVPYEKTKDGYRLSVSDTSEATKLIVAHPELFRDYEITKGKMDDVFLAVTGKVLEKGEDK
jgi:multidrug/hemolysin transport system ATP-binding protein